MVPKIVISDFLEIINYVVDNKQEIDSLPFSTSYKFINFKSLNLDKTYFFKTKCCGKFVNNFKQFKKDEPSCCGKIISHRSIISSKIYAFKFNLGQIIQLLLGKFGIENEPDYLSRSPVYQKLKSLKPLNRLILISFIDAIPVSKNVAIYNFFVKINNLNAPLKNRIFLYGSYIYHSEPDVNFFMKPFIKELNELFKSGIMINNQETIVFPVLFVSLLDSGARYKFLCYSCYNTYYGCTSCLSPGKNVFRYRRTLN